MPSASKVKWSQLRVGVMAVIALVVLAVLLILLTGSQNPFAKRIVIYTYLNDSAAMTEGASVRLNGILVGKVHKIGLSGQSDPGRVIRMELQIDERFMQNIPVDSEIALSAENVLGAKFLNIKRGQSKETIKPGSELHARDDKDFLEVVQSALPLLDSMKTILGRIDRIVATVESGQGSIGKLLVSDEIYKRLNNVLQDVETLTNLVSKGEGTIGKLLNDEAVYDDLRRTLGRMDSILVSLQQGEGSAGKILKDPALYNELKAATTEFRIVVADLNAGKGTAGKLLKDPRLHDRLMAVLGSLNKTIENINTGQGTLGQLAVNPQLYETLNGTTEEVRGLLKDFRANPKKFLTIQLKLF
jgi:phospholipid/cholesterol/gamma-HCH transport system substrate-binding protein